MNNENENTEIFDDDEIVTLTDDEGNEIDFYEVACVEYEDNFYGLLEPVNEMEGLEEGDVLIFRIVEQENGEDSFEPVEDEDLLNAVFEQYMRAAADCECDCEECDCEECEGDCDDCKKGE